MDALAIWTLYDHPNDFPHSYVARKFLIEGGAPIATDEMIVSPILMPLREMMALWGLTCIPRAPGDDPKVIESWL